MDRAAGEAAASPTGGLNPVALMPNPLQSADRWLTPDSRDFFAVYIRAGGASVPFR